MRPTARVLHTAAMNAPFTRPLDNWVSWTYGTYIAQWLGCRKEDDLAVNEGKQPDEKDGCD